MYLMYYLRFRGKPEWKLFKQILASCNVAVVQVIAQHITKDNIIQLLFNTNYFSASSNKEHLKKKKKVFA